MVARKWLFVAGCGLSAAFLAAILWRLDWPVFAAELRRLRFAWLAAAVIFIVAGIALRSFRWNLVAGAPLASYPAFWNAAVIGLTINQIYPLRAGEIVRIFALRKMTALPLGQAATSALIDRLADVLLLGISAIAVVAARSGIFHAEKLAAGTLLVVVAALAALFAFTKWDRIWRGWIVRWSARASVRFQERIERFYSGALATARLIASPARLVQIVALTTVIFAFDFAIMFSVLKAFEWDLPAIASVTILVFLAIGTSLPSAPGYAGVYQVACILALSLFGVGESQAVAYSVVLQVCVLATIVALAGVLAARHRVDLKLVRGALVKIT